MWLLTDLADWWDGKKEETSEILHEFVDEHPSWWAIAIAGTVETSMRLGAGFVDILRLGDGIRQGTWRGALHDGVRLLSVLGPAYRVGRQISRFVAADPGGPVCAWVSATQALRQTGTKHLATIEDIVAATGKTPGKVSTVADWRQLLESVGADVRSLPPPVDMAAVAKLAATNRSGVVMFGIKWLHPTAGKTVGHAMYAFRDLFGVIRIVDRTGRSVASLSELGGLYPGIASAEVAGALLLKNSKVVTLVNGTSAAAIEVRASMLASREVAEAEYARFKMLRDAGHSPSVAARPHKAMSAGAAGQSNGSAVNQPKPPAPPAAHHPKPQVRTPGPRSKTSGGPAVSRVSNTHIVIVAKPGDTWESVFRPFHNKGNPMPFDDFWRLERATNVLVGNAPKVGPLKPGMRVKVY